MYSKFKHASITSVPIAKLHLLAKFSKKDIQQTYVPTTVCVPQLRFRSLTLSESSLLRLAEFCLYGWWPNWH